MKALLNLLAFIFFACGTAHAQDEVLFVGGAPLDSYQPRVIMPLLKEAFKRNGIRFHAEYYPSSRSLLLSNRGEADGELHRVYDFHTVSHGRYPNLVRIESHLMSVYLVVFSKEAGPAEQWEDLKGFDVGYQRGRQNVKTYLGNALSAEDIHPKNTDLTAFMMLGEGRLDYVVSERMDGQRLIQTHPELKNIKEVGCLKETKIYTYMHKRHAKLAETVAATLEEMKQDGTFQRIVEEVKKEMLSGRDGEDLQ